MADNNRKSKVINPHFQYRTAFTVILVAIIVINLFIVVAALAPGLMERLSRDIRYVYYVIGIVEVALIYVFWKKVINTTHKVAGPVYAIDRELKKLREGDLALQIQLRPRDEFRDTADSINASIDYLRREIHEIKDLVARVRENPTPDEVDRLADAVGRFRT